VPQVVVVVVLLILHLQAMAAVVVAEVQLVDQPLLAALALQDRVLQEVTLPTYQAHLVLLAEVVQVQQQPT
jgi:hypothetical protein